jgi:hypothetical protein
MNPPVTLVAGALLTLAVATCPTGPSQLMPTCPDPAPLLGERTDATGYIVVFHEGTPAAAVAEELARRYEFTLRHVYEHAIAGFAAEFSDAVLAAIRCEAPVRHVEYDRTITVR